MKKSRGEKSKHEGKQIPGLMQRWRRECSDDVETEARSDAMSIPEFDRKSRSLVSTEKGTWLRNALYTFE